MSDLMMTLIGAGAIGVPALTVLWIVLRKQARAIFQFAVVLLAVGLGYLSATGTNADIGRKVMGLIAAPVKAPAPAR